MGHGASAYAPPPAPRAAWGALVLLHGLLLALMWTARVDVTVVRERRAQRRAPVPVAIPSTRPPVPAAAAPRARHRPAPPTTTAPRSAARGDARTAAASPETAARPMTGGTRAPWRPPLNLDLPPAMRAPAPASAPAPLTPAQEAMRDPRSNRLVLTPQEQRDIAAGNVECVAWQRDPDGTIFRGAGHWEPDLSLGPRPDGSYVMHCVDGAHQVAVPVLPMPARRAHQ